MKVLIPSDFTESRAVQETLLDAARRAGFPEEEIFGIRLAVEEALINAVKHGNKLDPDKNVSIEFQIADGRFDLTIEDQGAGFDRGSVPDPTAAENIEKSHGRGILLMEAYMDRVEWSKGGRRVHMVKQIEPQTAEPSGDA